MMKVMLNEGYDEELAGKSPTTGRMLCECR